MSSLIDRRILILGSGLLALTSTGCRMMSTDSVKTPTPQAVASEQNPSAGLPKTDFHSEISRDQQFNVHVEMARVHESQGNYEAALAEYLQAVEAGEKRGSGIAGGRLGPEHLALAHRRMGATYDRMGRFVLAEAEYNKALKLAPGDSKVWNDAGYSFYLQNRLDDAEHALKTAQSIEPSNPKILTNLGLTLAVAGKTEEALVVLAKAGGPAAGHANLGFILAANGKLDEAREQYQTALTLQPELASAAQALAQLSHATMIVKPSTTVPQPIDQAIASVSVKPEPVVAAPTDLTEASATKPDSSVLQEVAVTPTLIEENLVDPARVEDSAVTSASNRSEPASPNLQDSAPPPRAAESAPAQEDPVAPDASKPSVSELESPAAPSAADPSPAAATLPTSDNAASVPLEHSEPIVPTPAAAVEAPAQIETSSAPSPQIPETLSELPPSWPLAPPSLAKKAGVPPSTGASSPQASAPSKRMPASVPSASTQSGLSATSKTLPASAPLAAASEQSSSQTTANQQILGTVRPAPWAEEVTTPVKKRGPSKVLPAKQPGLPSKTVPAGTVPGWTVPNGYKESTDTSTSPKPSAIPKKTTPDGLPSNMAPPEPW